MPDTPDDSFDAPVMLSVLVWQDTRTEAEQEASLPHTRKAVSALIDPACIVSFSENRCTEQPGTLVLLDAGCDMYVAADFEAFRRAFLEVTGVRVVEVG